VSAALGACGLVACREVRMADDIKLQVAHLVDLYMERHNRVADLETQINELQSVSARMKRIQPDLAPCLLALAAVRDQHIGMCKLQVANWQLQVPSGEST
jgi:hypothetical protein